MPPILRNLKTSGVVERGAGAASGDDQQSGFDQGNGNLEGMRDEKSEKINLDRSFCDFELEFPEAFDTWGYYKMEGAENREDIDSILSGTRTDGDCSGTEAISSTIYHSDNRVVMQIPGVVEHAASWRDDLESGSDIGIGEWNVEGTRDKEFGDFSNWFHSDWKGDSNKAYYSSGTDEMQSTKYPEDIHGIVSGATADGCNENEAISRVYESNNTMQRSGISFSENVEGLKRNSWGDTTRLYSSISGAPVPKTPFCTRSSLTPLTVSSYPDYSTTFSSDALSADLSMDDCDRNSHSSLSSSPFFRGQNLIPPAMFLRETIHHKGHNVADQREAHTSKREKASENDISYDSLSQHFGRPLDDARKSFGVSRTAFKTMCRDVGIMRWKYGKRNMGRNSSATRRRLNDEVPGRRNFSSSMPPVQDTPVVAHTRQDLNKMTVKATYNGAYIRFKLPDLSGKFELEDNVIKRLHLERNTFTIKYQDDDGDWISIACDEDLQECMDIYRSSNKTTIKMLIQGPVDHYAS